MVHTPDGSCNQRQRQTDDRLGRNHRGRTIAHSHRNVVAQLVGGCSRPGNRSRQRRDTHTQCTILSRLCRGPKLHPQHIQFRHYMRLARQPAIPYTRRTRQRMVRMDSVGSSYAVHGNTPVVGNCRTRMEQSLKERHHRIPQPPCSTVPPAEHHGHKLPHTLTRRHPHPQRIHRPRHRDSDMPRPDGTYSLHH